MWDWTHKKIRRGTELKTEQSSVIYAKRDKTRQAVDECSTDNVTQMTGAKWHP